MTTHVPSRPTPTTLLDAEAVARILSRIAHEVIERNPDLGEIALVGIHTRGVPLARRIQALVAERSGFELEASSSSLQAARAAKTLRRAGAAASAAPA